MRKLIAWGCFVVIAIVAVITIFFATLPTTHMEIRDIRPTPNSATQPAPTIIHEEK